ncbi:MAG: aminotransferase class V-fold PLP-dependent enzyme [Candidatus Odinarchaeota archaeon]
MELPRLTFDYLRENIVGRNNYFTTPFGEVLLTYADYTASGRALHFIEDYLQFLLGSYANTHTEDDITGKHMTGLLHEAEKMIKQCFNAGDNCYIIASGTGATGAIKKFQEIIGVYQSPFTKNRREQLITEALKSYPSMEESQSSINAFISGHKPVVFIGPYEHHSNDIMWREGLCDVIEVELTVDGLFDLEDLEKKVSNPKYENRMKIGSFSAASNITGVRSPVYDIARICHRHGALACFDFAASAPYVEIDMNKDDEAYFDAVFLSTHKFLGGPGGSGILVINKKHYNDKLPPTVAAGGTVDYVSRDDVLYIADAETREKPGTPGILQTIKAALAINLKDAVGIEEIENQELLLIKKALARFKKHPNIEILGNQEPENRIAIFSLLFKHQERYLHPKLATRLLNDLFGIQSRAGCSCAGPYGHRLLQIGKKTSLRYRQAIEDGFQCVKPGWTRINFHYTMSDEEFDFICQAIEFIADYGHLFIPLYVLDEKTGEWKHRDEQTGQDMESLDISSVIVKTRQKRKQKKLTDFASEYRRYLERGKMLTDQLQKTGKKEYSRFDQPLREELRYFYFLNKI